MVAILTTLKSCLLISFFILLILPPCIFENTPKIEKNTRNAWRKKKCLVVAPTIYQSHYALQKRLALALAQQDWLDEVHLLILGSIEKEVGKMEEERRKLPKGKLHLKYFAYETESFPLEEWELREVGHPDEYTTGSDPEIFLEMLVQEKELIGQLKGEQFDIGVAEAWDYAALPLFWLLGVPNTVATLNYSIPSNLYFLMKSNYFEAILRQQDIPEMWQTMCGDCERSGSFKEYHRINLQFALRDYQEMDANFGGICRAHYNPQCKPPTFLQLFAQTKFLFVNSQPFLDFKMPVKPTFPEKVVFIGGISLPRGAANQRPTAPEEMMSKLDQQEKDVLKKVAGNVEGKEGKKEGEGGGLIIVSFGSMIKMEAMPDDIFHLLLTAFQAFPNYEFLWKFDSKEGANDVGKWEQRMDAINRAENVHAKSWLSQPALLANSHTKLLISHCGINSVLEAAHYGIPLLCLPLFGDQFYNAEALAKQNAAVVMNKDRLGSVEKVMTKIKQSLQQSYQHKMRMLKKKIARSNAMEIFLKKMRTLLLF